MSSADSTATADVEGNDVLQFDCNVCGAENRLPRAKFDREAGECAACGSTVRTRALVRMLARELFGLDVALPDFPVLQNVRGIGLSDSADYAERLATKFSYRNTFYDREPRFDLLNFPESETCRYDFVIASEVFEHVTPPVERAFASAFRLLKPDGLLFFTVPYALDGPTVEHYPQLHDWGIAQLAERQVLVNRTADGRLEVFDDLEFHGGRGQTLEMRKFTEPGLREHVTRAGFRSLEIHGGNCLAYGIVHEHDWSLPMTARKQPFGLSRECIAEIVAQGARLRADVRKLEALLAERERWVQWANDTRTAHENELDQRARWALDLERQLRERTAWALDLERQAKERTQWALHLDDEVARHTALVETYQAEARRLEREAAALREELTRLKTRMWSRVGRKLGTI